MRTTAGQFRKMHIHSGENHAAEARMYGKLAMLLAKAAIALRDEDTVDAADCLSEVCAELNGHAYRAAQSAEWNAQEAKSFLSGADEADDESEDGEDKAAGLADLHKGAVRDSVSVITPDAPGVRPVFRTGQPQGLVGVARPAGDVLENLFKLDSDLF